MIYFTTLFDSFYLSRGLVMYESLKAQTEYFHLYIFAFDEISLKILNELNLEKVTVISLKEFESPELLEIKSSRTKAEYCWTCTPSTIKYVLDKFSLIECTYIDADLMFFSDPCDLLNEMNENGKNVLITEHRYSTLPKLYSEKRAGRFCVQFVTFKNERESLKVLNRWRSQCVEWCFSRYENGKFGDQKYLDEWPEIYQNVHILNNPGGGIAPWNIGQYILRKTENSITGIIKKNKNKFDVVFYHYQYVKLLENGSVDIGWYYIPQKVRKLFYFPYLEKISKNEEMLNRTFTEYKTGFTKFDVNNFKNLFKTGLKKIFMYNMIKLN
ncbi:MAG: glycosyl transferase [Bacteroidia bacterium]|nr:glycosyl transferase [Bacteroidia bacterium]